MSDRMLVVVGEVVDGLLLTDVPVPTEGQPEWGRCSRCGVRAMATLHHHPEVDSFEPMSFDGPFPFTVAVWQEVDLCTECGEPAHEHDPDMPVYLGAVVATVEVTGEGHHADECVTGDSGIWQACSKFARLSGWHTPVRVVGDGMIPMERPTDWRDCEAGSCEYPGTPFPHQHGAAAGSWWAEVDA